MRTLERHYEQLRDWKFVQDCQAIDITGAAKWFYEESDQDAWDLCADYPMVTPPFECTWLEYGNIGFVRANGKIKEEHRDNRDGRMAMAILTMRFEPEHQRMALEQDVMRPILGGFLGKRQRIPDRQDLTEHRLALAEALERGQLPKWGIACLVFADLKKSSRLMELGAAYFYLDSHGQPITTGAVPIVPMGPMRELAQRPGQGAAAADAIISGIHPFFFALSLMNAKNVSLVDAPLPLKVAAKRGRSGKTVLSFKTLHIEPMKARARSEATTGESHLRRALHICRGHFKDFREGPGLFGKYKGLYWWDSQVRGTDESGRIIKDYSLGSPQGP